MEKFKIRGGEIDVGDAWSVVIEMLLVLMHETGQLETAKRIFDSHGIKYIESK